MGRKALGNVRRVVNFDPYVWKALELSHFNSFTGKMHYGAVSDEVNAILQKKYAKLIAVIKEEEANG